MDVLNFNTKRDGTLINNGNVNVLHLEDEVTYVNVSVEIV